MIRHVIVMEMCIGVFVRLQSPMPLTELSKEREKVLEG